MPAVKHIISWSGGKDSTATVILMKEHKEELLSAGDEVVVLFTEVMFDKKNHVSGHNPDIIDFIYEKKTIFEGWGFEVEILHAAKDYLDIFYHKLKRSPDAERVGLTHGFVPAGICAVKRECKLKPIDDYKSSLDDYVEYIGIAADETDRLRSMHKIPNVVSLLEKYHVTEKDAKELCIRYNMLSPQYTMPGQARDGCWFCSNAKLCEHKAIREKNRAAWDRYVALENVPNLAYRRWNPYSEETLHQRDQFLQRGYRQMTIFEHLSDTA